MKRLVPLLLLLIAAFTGVALIKSKADSAKSGPSELFSIILSPFGSKDILGQWQGETAPFMNTIKEEKDVSGRIPMCDKAFVGYIYKQPVLVVVSGIGKVKTTACITNIMQVYKNQVKEVILSGIGGISSNKGAMIGDLCINSVSADYDLQYYGADQNLSKEQKPEFWSSKDPNPASRLYTNPKLAEELISASGQIEWAVKPKEADEIDQKYHSSTRETKVWGSKECAEISGDLFWHDYQSDIRARTIASELLNAEWNQSKTPDDTVIITSMESIAVGNVVYWWNKANGTQINFAYVRAASNYNHALVSADGTPLNSAKASLESGMKNESTEYAAQTAALPVLKMFEIRNLKEY